MNKGQTDRSQNMAVGHKRLSSIVLEGSDAVVTETAEKSKKNTWLAATSEDEEVVRRETPRNTQRTLKFIEDAAKALTINKETFKMDHENSQESNGPDQLTFSGRGKLDATDGMSNKREEFLTSKGMNE